jgi:uncharacterized protein YegL
VPKLIQDENDLLQGTVGSFTFSGIRPEKLGSTEYTLVQIARDYSGSISGFEDVINDCLKMAIASCKHSPKAESLLVRTVKFSSAIVEEHGFQLLSSIDPDTYQPAMASGATVLYDAIYACAGVARNYAKTLTKNNFLVNAISFIITDGEDAGSRMSTHDIKSELDKLVKSEELESHLVILIGINATHLANRHQDIVQQCGLSGYIDAGNADAKGLAKLASFISRSVSSQSSSLGTGGASQLLTI